MIVVQAKDEDGDEYHLNEGRPREFCGGMRVRQMMIRSVPLDGGMRELATDCDH